MNRSCLRIHSRRDVVGHSIPRHGVGVISIRGLGLRLVVVQALFDVRLHGAATAHDAEAEENQQQTAYNRSGDDSDDHADCAASARRRLVAAHCIGQRRAPGSTLHE